MRQMGPTGFCTQGAGAGAQAAIARRPAGPALSHLHRHAIGRAQLGKLVAYVGGEQVHQLGGILVRHKADGHLAHSGLCVCGGGVCVGGGVGWEGDRGGGSF
jgi:hypothetical protein